MSLTWTRSGSPREAHARRGRLFRLIVAETIAFLMLVACVAAAFVGAALVGAL